MNGKQLAVVMCTWACSPSAARTAAFESEVRVLSDHGLPIQHARVRVNGQNSLETDDQGRASLRLEGREGAQIPIAIECPAGYEQFKTPVSIPLVRARSVQGEPLSAIPLDLTCERTSRDVVVLVDAPGGASIPVNVHGLPAGHTDLNGSAHIVLSVSRAMHTLEVSLDTTRQDDLVPRMPSRTFELGGSDTVLLFRQSFAPIVVNPPPKPPKPKSIRKGPTRVD
jgi:hypothetical protein